MICDYCGAYLFGAMIDYHTRVNVDLNRTVLYVNSIIKMNHFFIHLGRVLIGVVASISVLLSVLFIIGFFMHDVQKEYLVNGGSFLLCLV